MNDQTHQATTPIVVINPDGDASHIITTPVELPNEYRRLNETSSFLRNKLNEQREKVETLTDALAEPVTPWYAEPSNNVTNNLQYVTLNRLHNEGRIRAYNHLRRRYEKDLRNAKMNITTNEIRIKHVHDSMDAIKPHMLSVSIEGKHMQRENAIRTVDELWRQASAERRRRHRNPPTFTQLNLFRAERLAQVDRMWEHASE